MQSEEEMVSRRIESRLDILVVAVIAHVALRKLDMHHSKCKLSFQMALNTTSHMRDRDKHGTRVDIHPS